MANTAFSPHGKRRAKKLDWKSIQAFYDKGNTPVSCCNKFRIYSGNWGRAIKRGDIVIDPKRAKRKGISNQDVSGKRFGRLVALRRVTRETKRKWEPKTSWVCLCDCGQYTNATVGQLNYGCKKSCGCVRRFKGEVSCRWSGHKEIPGAFWGRTKSRAARFNREFTITPEYAWDLFVKQNRKCAISGLDIGFGFRNNNGRPFHTASIDRIDSSLGYSEGNIQWVHKDVNTMKWDMDEKHFLALVEKINLFQAKKHERSPPKEDDIGVEPELDSNK